MKSRFGGAPRRLAACGLLVASAVAAACALGSHEESDLAELADANASALPDVRASAVPDASSMSDRASATDTDAGDCTRKVLINELKTGGPGANDEFVELYNPGSCAVPLGGWKLLYRSKANGLRPVPLVAFETGDGISAKAHLLFAPAAAAGKKDGELAPGMAAADGQVGLVDDADALVDAVGYGGATGDFVEGKAAPSPPAGASIGRKKGSADTDANDVDFEVFTVPTPGVANAN